VLLKEKKDERQSNKATLKRLRKKLVCKINKLDETYVSLKNHGEIRHFEN